MATLIRLVSLSMGLYLCCLKSLALLQVWLCSRMSKSSSMGDVLTLIKHQFHVPTYQVNVWNNHVFTLSTNLDPLWCLFDHHGDVFDTWTKWARPQAEWAQGPAGRPNSLASWPGFEAVWPEPWLSCVYTRRISLSQWRKSVEAAPPGRPAMWLGRPATT
jgi:hypothetical protein